MVGAGRKFCVRERQSSELLLRIKQMINQPISNPNDFKVVSFHNSTDFGFTAEMGCMYDGRAITHPEGGPGIPAGKSMTLPYHIGHRLATNLAKAVLIRGSSNAPQKDADGNVMIKAIWNDVELERIKNTFIKDLYSEEKPATESQTDLLMKKVEDLNKMVEGLVGAKAEAVTETAPSSVPPAEGLITPPAQAPTVLTYQDKAEVIAELEKRKIQHDKRKSKAELEKLLA